MAAFQPSKTYTAGIIGLGGMGRIMLGEMNAHPRFEVAAAWDPDDRACLKAVEGNSWLEIVQREEALMARSDINLIYIASPPRSHAVYLEAAWDAGKAVFCEKPLGVDLEMSRALLADVKSNDAKTAINFTHAASLDAERAQLALKAGDLGRVAYVSMNLHLPTWPREFQKDADWLRYRQEGGFTREVLSHWIYLSLRLFGPGQVVSAHSHYPDDEALAEERIIAELDFNGTPALINAGVGGRGPVGMEYTVWGSKRSLRLSSGGGMLVHETDGWRPFLAAKDTDASDRVRALDNLADLLDGKPNTAATLAQGFQVQTIIETLLADHAA
ncbi:MAG: Gfo/Idh/MocA family oxidoreductase [Gammaproteobacteria bacterium]|nr:Gfo/Idh/MocA family oxidoreductase [Gammaproteobacteria bacterium]